jgi:DNA-binding MarR family transcriptional regulator
MRKTSKMEGPPPGDAVRLFDLGVALARRRSLRDPIAASCGVEEILSPPQIHTLLCLGMDGALTMGDIARRASVTEKSATGLVDRLERDGYVQRDRDAADRRVVHVKLTARGGEAFRSIEQRIRAKLAALLDLLDAEDRRALFRILQNLVDRLGGPSEDRP